MKKRYWKRNEYEFELSKQWADQVNISHNLLKWMTKIKLWTRKKTHRKNNHSVCIRRNRTYRIVLLCFVNNINGEKRKKTNSFHSIHSALFTHAIKICINIFPVNCFSPELSLHRSKTFSTWKITTTKP